MTKLPYQEGDVFAVPLRGGQYALGVTAGMPATGKILVGYFFEYVFSTPPTLASLPNLDPHEAIKIFRFGDLRLINSTWPIIGAVAGWHRQEWPIPKFLREDPLTKRAWLISYSDVDPAIGFATVDTDASI
jgi:Immunity protein 26